MKKITFAFLSAVMLLIACGTSKQVEITNSWLNREKMKDRPVKKIYLMALFNNPNVSSTLEYVLEEEAKSRRYMAHRHREVFPYTIDDPEEAKKLILQNVKSLGCDAIFVTALKDVQSETHYVSTSSIGVGAGGYYPMDGYQNNFNSYYTGYYVETSLSGYYETNHLYFIESNLYDTNTLELLWSVQSKSYNPTDVEKVSKEYCDELFKLLEKEEHFRGRKTADK